MKTILYAALGGIVGAAALATASDAGWKGTRSTQYSDECRPYNGPHGYYGNPYCEGGFNRYGKSGKYEIDITRFFDERYYDDRRDRRRYR
jgi:hypothetical protein